jgi:hypothetical protein
MSFNAVVENDTIKLPPDVHLPDGTRVIVHPHVEPPVGHESMDDAFESFIGCVRSEVGDLAENHDHYAHGAPKGIDRL